MLEWHVILSLTCSIAGIIFFVISLFIVKKIKNLFPQGSLTKKWAIIQGFIGLFLCGYILNIVLLLLDLQDVIILTTAAVYLFGGMFVFFIIYLGYKTYKLILLESK
ncbi:MAG: hypothetical protein ACTSO4_14590 [Promethearchaeota archaeon]